MIPTKIIKEKKSDAADSSMLRQEQSLSSQHQLLQQQQLQQQRQQQQQESSLRSQTDQQQSSNANPQRHSKNGVNSPVSTTPTRGTTNAPPFGVEREVDFTSNPTVLCSLIVNRKFQSAIKRLRNYPFEASIWLCSKTKRLDSFSQQIDYNDQQQLQQRQRDSKEALKQSYHFFPLQGFQRRNSWSGSRAYDDLYHHYHHQTEYSFRQLPLHLACSSLIQTSPFYPRHNNSRNSQRQDLELLVAHLALVYPHACSKRDHAGRLPLHEAINWMASPEIISIFLMASPEALLERDRYGRSPDELIRSIALTWYGENEDLNASDVHNHTNTVADLLNRGVDFWLYARSEAMIRKRSAVNSQQQQQQKPKQNLESNVLRNEQAILGASEASDGKRPKKVQHPQEMDHEQPTQKNDNHLHQQQEQQQKDQSQGETPIGPLHLEETQETRSDNSVLEWRRMLLEKGLQESQRKNAELMELVKTLRKEKEDAQNEAERLVESQKRKLIEAEDEASDLKKKLARTEIVFHDMGLDSSGHDRKGWDEQPVRLSVMGMDPEPPTGLSNYLEGKLDMLTAENDDLILENQRCRARIAELEDEIRNPTTGNSNMLALLRRGDRMTEREKLLTEKVAELENLLKATQPGTSVPLASGGNSPAKMQTGSHYDPEIRQRRLARGSKTPVTDFTTEAKVSYETPKIISPVAKHPTQSQEIKRIGSKTISTTSSSKSATSWSLLSLTQAPTRHRKKRRRPTMPVLPQENDSFGSVFDSLGDFAEKSGTDNLEELFKSAAHFYHDQKPVPFDGQRSISFFQEFTTPLHYHKAARRFSDGGASAPEMSKRFAKKNRMKARGSNHNLVTPARILAAEEECNAIVKEAEKKLKKQLPKELISAFHQASSQLAATLDGPVGSDGKLDAFHLVAEACIDFTLIDDAQRIYGETIPVEVVSSIRAASQTRIDSSLADIDMVGHMKLKLKQELVDALVNETEKQLGRPLEHDLVVALDETSKKFDSLLYEVARDYFSTSSFGMRLDFKEMDKMFKEAQHRCGLAVSKDVIVSLWQASFVLQSRLEGTDIVGSPHVLNLGELPPRDSSLNLPMMSSPKSASNLFVTSGRSAFGSTEESKRGDELDLQTHFRGDSSMNITNIFPELNSPYLQRDDHSHGGIQHKNSQTGVQTAARERVGSRSPDGSKGSQTHFSDEEPGAMYRRARARSRSPTQQAKGDVYFSPLKRSPQRFDSADDLRKIYRHASLGRASPSDVDLIDACDIMSDCESEEFSVDISSLNLPMGSCESNSSGGSEQCGNRPKRTSAASAASFTKSLAGLLKRLIRGLVKEAKESGAEISSDLADALRKALSWKFRTEAKNGWKFESKSDIVSSIARFLRDDEVIDEMEKLYGEPVTARPLAVLLAVADAKAVVSAASMKGEAATIPETSEVAMELNVMESDHAKAVHVGSEDALSADDNETDDKHTTSSQVFSGSSGSDMSSILKAAEQLLGRHIPSDLKDAIHRAKHSSEGAWDSSGGAYAGRKMRFRQGKEEGGGAIVESIDRESSSGRRSDSPAESKAKECVRSDSPLAAKVGQDVTSVIPTGTRSAPTSPFRSAPYPLSDSELQLDSFNASYSKRLPSPRKGKRPFDRAGKLRHAKSEDLSLMAQLPENKRGRLRAMKSSDSLHGLAEMLATPGNDSLDDLYKRAAQHVDGLNKELQTGDTSTADDASVLVSAHHMPNTTGEAALDSIIADTEATYDIDITPELVDALRRAMSLGDEVPFISIVRSLHHDKVIKEAEEYYTMPIPKDLVEALRSVSLPPGVSVEKLLSSGEVRSSNRDSFEAEIAKWSSAPSHQNGLGEGEVASREKKESARVPRPESNAREGNLRPVVNAGRIRTPLDVSGHSHTSWGQLSVTHSPGVTRKKERLLDEIVLRRSQKKKRTKKEGSDNLLNSLANLDEIETSADDYLSDRFRESFGAVEQSPFNELERQREDLLPEQYPSVKEKLSPKAKALEPVSEMSNSQESENSENGSAVPRPQTDGSCLQVSPQELELDILFDTLYKLDGVKIPYDIDLAIRKASRATDDSQDFITPTVQQIGKIQFGTYLTLGRLELLYEESSIFLGHELPQDLLDALRRSSTELKGRQPRRRNTPYVKQRTTNPVEVSDAECEDVESSGALEWQRTRGTTTDELRGSIDTTNVASIKVGNEKLASPATDNERGKSSDAKEGHEGSGSAEKGSVPEIQRFTALNDERNTPVRGFPAREISKANLSVDSYLSFALSAQTDNLEDLYKTARSAEEETAKVTSARPKSQVRKRDSGPLNRSNHSTGMRSYVSADTLFSAAQDRQTDDLQALFQAAYDQSPRVDAFPSSMNQSPPAPSFTKTPNSKSNASKMTPSSKSLSTRMTNISQNLTGGVYNSPRPNDFPVTEVSTPDRDDFGDSDDFNSISPMTLGSTLTDGSGSKEFRELETKDLLNASKARLKALSNSIPELDLSVSEREQKSTLNKEKEQDTAESVSPILSRAESKPEESVDRVGNSDEDMPPLEENAPDSDASQEDTSGEAASGELISPEDTADEDMPELVSMDDLRDSVDSIASSVNGASELNAILLEAQEEFGMELPLELVEALKSTSVGSLLSDNESFAMSDVSALIMQAYLQGELEEPAAATKKSTEPRATVQEKLESSAEDNSGSSSEKTSNKVELEERLNRLTRIAENTIGAPLPVDILRALRKAALEDSSSTGRTSSTNLHGEELERVLESAARVLGTPLPGDIIEALRKASESLNVAKSLIITTEVQSASGDSEFNASGYFSDGSDSNSISADEITLGNSIHDILQEVKNVHGEVPPELLETLQKMSDDGVVDMEMLQGSLAFEYPDSMLLEYSASTMGSRLGSRRSSLGSVGSLGSSGNPQLFEEIATIYEDLVDDKATTEHEIGQENEKVASIDMFIYEATKEYGKPLPQDLVIALRSSSVPSGITIESDLNGMIHQAEKAIGGQLPEGLTQALQRAAYSEALSSGNSRQFSSLSGGFSSLSSATTLNNSADSEAEWTLDESIDIESLLDKVALDASIPLPPPPPAPPQPVGTPTRSPKPDSKQVLNKNLGPKLLAKVKRVYRKKIPLELSYVLSRSEELAFARNTDEDIDIILAECEEMSGKLLPADLVVALREASVAHRAQTSSSRGRRNRISRQSSGSYRSSSRSSGGMPSILESAGGGETEIESTPNSIVHVRGSSRKDSKNSKSEDETYDTEGNPPAKEDIQTSNEPKRPSFISLNSSIDATDSGDIGTLKSSESGVISSLSSDSPFGYEPRRQSTQSTGSEPSLTLDDLMMAPFFDGCDQPPSPKNTATIVPADAENSLTLDDLINPKPKILTQTMLTTSQTQKFIAEACLNLDDLVNPSERKNEPENSPVDNNSTTKQRENKSEKKTGSVWGPAAKPTSVSDGDALARPPPSQQNAARRIVTEHSTSEESSSYASPLNLHRTFSYGSETTNVSKVSASSTLVTKKTPLGVDSTPPLEGVESDDLNAILKEAARRFR